MNLSKGFLVFGLPLLLWSSLGLGGDKVADRTSRFEPEGLSPALFAKQHDLILEEWLGKEGRSGLKETIEELSKRVLSDRSRVLWDRTHPQVKGAIGQELGEELLTTIIRNQRYGDDERRRESDKSLLAANESELQFILIYSLVDEDGNFFGVRRKLFNPKGERPGYVLVGDYSITQLRQAREHSVSFLEVDYHGIPYTIVHLQLLGELTGPNSAIRSGSYIELPYYYLDESSVQSFRLKFIRSAAKLLNIKRGQFDFVIKKHEGSWGIFPDPRAKMKFYFEKKVDGLGFGNLGNVWGGPHPIGENDRIDVLLSDIYYEGSEDGREFSWNKRGILNFYPASEGASQAIDDDDLPLASGEDR